MHVLRRMCTGDSCEQRGQALSCSDLYQVGRVRVFLDVDKVLLDRPRGLNKRQQT